jgi:hypothetical protein
MAKLLKKGSRIRCRLSSPKGYKRAQSRIPVDELPYRETTSRTWGWQLRERHMHTEPLRRFLESRVGRAWNDVYSELCRDLHCDGRMRHEINSRLDWFVERNVRMVEGEPRDSRGMRLLRSRGKTLWVHPETGVLMLTQGKRRTYQRKPKHEMVELGANRKAVLLDGFWFEIVFAEIPLITPKFTTVKPAAGNGSDSDGTNEGDSKTGANAQPTAGWDVVLHDWASRYTNLPRWRDGSERFRSQWGAAIYAVSKRQMNKREIRRFKKSMEEGNRSDG